MALSAAGAALWTAAGLATIRLFAPSRGSQAALSARLTPAERNAIRAGRVRFLDGRTACRLATGPPDGGRGKRRNRAEVLVILNTPAVFRPGGRLRGASGSGGGSGGEEGDGERVLAVTRAAAKLGARLMVDCTDADLGRLTPAGWRSVLLAKRAGIWRMVIFDGAHHLPALAADPEILLLPVLRVGGEPLVIHGYVRDALPLAALRRVLAAAGLEPVMFTIPRLSLPLKEHLPLRLVVLEALGRMTGAPAPSPAGQPCRPGDRLPLARIVVQGGAARLPGGLLLAARRAGGTGETWETGRAAAASPKDGPARQAWVGVSYGTFTLAAPSPSARAGGGTADHPRHPPAVVKLGWPVSVWDLLLRYPGALAGRPLPWSRPGGSEQEPPSRCQIRYGELQ
ncbi:MAG: hypothetical protein QME79_07400 [Bacillota bacterium]|nr:hypothetical protein [Bacillota bacterium]